MAKCPERGPLAQHVMGTAAEPELGLKAAMGERCRRVPGDGAGLSVASMKRFNQPRCPAACYAAAGPVLKASDALAAPVSCCALPSHPTAPSRASPSSSPSPPQHAGLLRQQAGSEGTGLPLPGRGGCRWARCIRHQHCPVLPAPSRRQHLGFFFWRFPVVGLLFLFVCFKSVLILVCP